MDIAGLVKGASEGEGLGNKFLQNIREVDAILEMVRVFEDPDIIHVHNEINPLSDIEVINFELILADAETVTKRLGNLQKDVKAAKKEAVFEEEILKRVDAHLKTGKLAHTLSLDEKELPIVKQLNLLTMSSILYALNTSEAAKTKKACTKKFPRCTSK